MAVYSQDALLGTAVVLPLLGIVAVALRFCVRLRVKRTYLGVDDWLVLAAVFLVCGHGIIQILMVLYGISGRDDTPSSQQDKGRLDVHNKLSHAIVVIEKATYSLIKLSVLFLYRRIFGANLFFRRTADALIVLVILWALVFLFVESFVCTADSSKTTCDAQEWTLLWFAITEVLGDIVILSLPYPLIRKLQMRRREKIGLAAIFALGTISTFIGIVRLGYVAKNFYLYFHPQISNDSDSAPSFWTTAEVSIGVLAACLPPLGPLLRLVPGPRKLFYSIRQGLSSWSHHHGRSASSRSRDAVSIAQQPEKPVSSSSLASSENSGTGSSNEGTISSERTWYNSSSEESNVTSILNSRGVV